MSLNPRDVVRKKVLIADDSVFVRHALCERFEREADFDVCGVVAENGREAIEAAGRLNPDLIVLDLSMPVMNGLDAARVLKRVQPTVPIIMFSMFEGSLSEKHVKLTRISEVSPIRFHGCLRSRTHSSVAPLLDWRVPPVLVT